MPVLTSIRVFEVKPIRRLHCSGQKKISHILYARLDVCCEVLLRGVSVCTCVCRHKQFIMYNYTFRVCVRLCVLLYATHTHPPITLTHAHDMLIFHNRSRICDGGTRAIWQHIGGPLYAHEFSPMYTRVHAYCLRVLLMLRLTTTMRCG